jgi:biopolymer transport protein ExbD
MFGIRRKKREKQMETDINRVVTPMLDMTFQILFYFVINFKPPIAEGQIDLNLPPEETGPTPQMSSLDPEDKADEYRITVYSSAGTIDLLTFKINNLEAQPLPNEDMMGALKAELKRIPKQAEGAKTKPPVVKIECDKNLKYSELMQIMNLCREQGFKDVGLLPRQKVKGGPATE